MRFLIDECLSPGLVQLARVRGYGESSHVVWMGRSGAKDWELVRFVLDGDWTLVTKNSADFRGSANDPGRKGHYAKVAIHAGLICLNGPPHMDLDMQIDLFDEALNELDDNCSLVNEALEITLDDNEIMRIQRYRLPPGE